MVTMDAADRIARRYPTTKRRWWVVVAAALGLVATLWLVWAGGYGATGTVSSRVDSFQVHSDTMIEVRITVERPRTDQAAECLLYAQAITYERVGETRISVPAGAPNPFTQTIELRTFRRATTAAVEGCRLG